MRKPYRHDSDIFDIKDLVSRDPITQFDCWFQEACKQPDIKEPNAIALATASRYVFVFFVFFIEFIYSILSKFIESRYNLTEKLD